MKNFLLLIFGSICGFAGVRFFETGDIPLGMISLVALLGGVLVLFSKEK